MSTKKQPLKVIRWAGRYLTNINRVGTPQFSYAPVHAERFETEEEARARTRDAEKFPGDYEVVDDPTGGK